ncbi:hypothetical protein [Aurantiacibacter luteus]|uniref:hypothetical protein n=1 Tax=Aurantiacibacter luteus TaxID=1581420 RepID=UPI0012DFFFDB|nr:hypothetical protein [Aurantiacibacter luteus]
MDSLSYVPAMRGEAFAPQRPVYWYSSRPRPSQTGDTAGLALRDGDWKFIRRFDPQEADELFNLAADPYETTNLAQREPQRASAMRARIEAWMTEIDAVAPQFQRGNRRKRGERDRDRRRDRNNGRERNRDRSQ